jgi:hypothetical protein
VKKPDAVTFAETLDPAVLRFGESKPPVAVCPWCGQALPAAGLDACPHCQAPLKPADEALEVPGVTTLAPEVVRMLEIAEAKKKRKAKGRFRTSTDEPILPVAPVTPDADEEMAAVRPPDAEVRRVMRELEIEAALAAAGLAAPGSASTEGEPATAAEPASLAEPTAEPSETPADQPSA